MLPPHCTSARDQLGDGDTAEFALLIMCIFCMNSQGIASKAEYLCTHAVVNRGRGIASKAAISYLLHDVRFCMDHMFICMLLLIQFVVHEHEDIIISWLKQRLLEASFVLVRYKIIHWNFTSCIFVT